MNHVPKEGGRRRLLRGAGSAGALSATLALPAVALPRRLLAATPACDAGRAAVATPRQTPGPFYLARSPRRSSLVDTGMRGERLVLSGRVLTADCRPVAGAWIDVWQADHDGDYDRRGFRLRGHLLADADGRYRIETIVPGRYPGRTRHLHVKVRPGEAVGPELTTQLYFPADDEYNRRDGLYDPALRMTMDPRPSAAGAGQATFDFVLAG